MAITSIISTTPIATLTSCFLRYAVGSPSVSASRGAVADQTSRVPSRTSASEASIRIQSTPAARRLMACSRWPVRFGGRIAPSSANTGSPLPATTPGIAAADGRTFSPSMP